MLPIENSSMNSFGGDGIFSLFSFFIAAIFFIVIGTILFKIIKGLIQWNQNNFSPLLTEGARVVSKRNQVWGGGGHASANTSYYVTFELEDGKRIEFRVAGKHFGMLVEGDYGELTYQGTRFKGFLRSVDNKF
ncbi:MAG: hypothetical protein K0R71_885 [Bacillales bacterium]|jgi:hypothetical protein|nr:hypothetical protein [Bacillales bacterium]